MDCPRCGLECHFRSALLKHLQRVNPCEPKLCDKDRNELYDEVQRGGGEKKYICKVCKKGFINRKSKYVHQKACKGSSNIVTATPTTDVQELSKTLVSVQAELAELKAAQSNLVRAAPITNNTTNNNTQNNINITVNAGDGVLLRDFGFENMAALPDNILETFFMDLRFRDLMEELHFDGNYPENNNVRLKSTKRGLMEIYRNNKWDVVTFVNGMNEMIEQGHKIFKDFYRKNRERILEEVMDESDLREILHKLDDIERLNKDEIMPIRKELQLLLETHRDTSLVQA
jgi:hypothetical protein